MTIRIGRARITFRTPRQNLKDTIYRELLNRNDELTQSLDNAPTDRDWDSAMARIDEIERVIDIVKAV